MKSSTIAILCCLFLSCAKETSTSLPSSFSCDINGSAWNAESFIIDRRDNKINVSASISGAEMLIMEVTDWGEKVYDLTSYNCYARVLTGGTKIFNIGQNGFGNLTISSIAGNEFNKRMSGTFHFTAFTSSGEKMEVTNGKFTNVSVVE